MAIHSALTGANLHEPKNLDSALAADAGKVLTPSTVDGVSELRLLVSTELSDSADLVRQAELTAAGGDITSAQTEANIKVVTLTIPDISTAGTEYLPVDRQYNVVGAYVVLYGAITIADATITISDGTTTFGTVVVDFATSGAGVKYENTSLTGSVGTGRVIQVSSDGGSTDAAKAAVTLVLGAV